MRSKEEMTPHITYTAGKFYYDGNEIVNTDLLKKHSGLQYGTGAPLEDGQQIPIPATLRAEVVDQYRFVATHYCGEWQNDYPTFINKNAIQTRKVVRLVEVESKPLDDNEQYKANIEACHEDHKKHLDKKRTGILAVGEADYEPAFPESKAEPLVSLPKDTEKPLNQTGKPSKLSKPDKQAIDERVKEIAGIAWKGAANAFRMYPNNSHTFASYWNGAKDQFKKFSLLEHHNTIASDGTQPPPQAESEEDVAVRFAMYGSGKCTVGDQEFFRGMFRNGHWRKHEINN